MHISVHPSRRLYLPALKSLLRIALIAQLVLMVVVMIVTLQLDLPLYSDLSTSNRRALCPINTTQLLLQDLRI